MRVLVCPDSFKGSLSAKEVTGAIAKGVERGCPGAVIDQIPMADGGEGTVDCVLQAVGGQKVWVPVHDPLGRLIQGFYGRLSDGTVVVEVAAAAGLGLIAEKDRDVMRGNTLGVGELIGHALDSGGTSFIIALGGSATNDAGLGMLHALGVRFFDGNGTELSPTPEGCLGLAHIDTNHLHSKVRQAQFRIACDVTNPLCGRHGATAVYGPQKGVTDDQIPILDGILANMAKVVEEDLGCTMKDIPGAGAAGGLGGAFVGVLGAEVVKGVDLLFELTSLETRLDLADVVITGEGKTDEQTLYGKVVQGIAARGKAKGVPVICLSGSITEGADLLYQHGVTALFSIAPGPITLEQAMAGAGSLITRSAEAAMRVFAAGQII